MRRLRLLALLLLTLPLLAGERAVAGPETLLGDATLVPIAEPSLFGNTAAMATNGDEVLLVWIARGSLYAQRLDRSGSPATPLPTLLVRGPRLPPMGGLRVLHAGGLYTIFVHANVEGKWASWAFRVTRELEIVDARIVTFDPINDVVYDGDEYVLATGRNVFRLRDDFSVIEMLPNFYGSVLAPSPHGALLITAAAPDITARMIDDSVPVRIASAFWIDAVRAMWTGTQFLVVWTDCPYTKALILDENLVARGAPVTLDDTLCTWDNIEIVKVAEDDVIVTWQSGESTRAQRLRGGVPSDSKLPLGSFVKTLYSPHGLLFTVDNQLNVRAFVPGTTQSPSTLPVRATPLAAAEESVLAVAASATEAAIARHRNDGTNIVSIVDRDGRPLRDVPIPSGDSVSLAHDGTSFYALVSDDLESRFQKVASGASAVRLPVRADPALVWAGSGFYILQSKYSDFTGFIQYRSRFLWLTREGVVELPPCENWEFPTTAGEPVVVRAGEEITVAIGFYLARIRGKCQTGPVVNVKIPYAWRAAWQNGTWAWILTDGSTLDLATADDPLSTPSLHRSAHNVRIWHKVYDLVPFGGHWLVVYGDQTLRASVHNAAGALVGTSVLANGIEGRPFLVPMGDRVLAVYRRQIYDPPYLGVHRVMVAPVTLETEVRRRVARP